MIAFLASSTVCALLGGHTLPVDLSGYARGTGLTEYRADGTLRWVRPDRPLLGKDLRRDPSSKVTDFLATFMKSLSPEETESGKPYATLTDDQKRTLGQWVPSLAVGPDSRLVIGADLSSNVTLPDGEKVTLFMPRGTSHVSLPDLPLPSPEAIPATFVSTLVCRHQLPKEGVITLDALVAKCGHISVRIDKRAMQWRVGFQYGAAPSYARLLSDALAVHRLGVCKTDNGWFIAASNDDPMRASEAWNEARRAIERRNFLDAYFAKVGIDPDVARLFFDPDAQRHDSTLLHRVLFRSRATLGAAPWAKFIQSPQNANKMKFSLDTNLKLGLVDGKTGYQNWTVGF